MTERCQRWLLQADEEWQTRDVHAEILGEPDAEDNPNHYWFELTERGRSAISTDDSDGDNIANLIEHFGEDAVLLRIGAGTNGTEDTDLYFRNLELNGTARGAFPVNGRGNGEAERRGN